MEKNIQKRLIIGLAYLIFFSLVFWFLYSVFKPKATCTDGLKNQNEEGVDCGGVCAVKCQKIEVKDLTTGETGVVESIVAGEYDFYGVVTNPNSVYGSKSFTYAIKFKDENGTILNEKQGTGFILPGEKKYIIENNIKLDKLPTSIDFSVTDPAWVELDELYEKPDLKVVSKNYAETGSGVGFSQASGLLQNRSPFDFALIKIKVILRDADGKIIALNATEMRTVKSGEDRDYRVSWPSRFPGAVSSVENQIEVNVFDSDAFVRKYFKAEKFQQL
ncbi:MAG: hypothetical protein NTY33_01395 [Candidatus Moranbacteria bacterium]|nr:hypothetical protein [Candidatus Moranbacteria bacterium]